jgi:hypothetical protein
MNHYICQKEKEKNMTSTMESNEMERLLRSLARVQEQPRPQTKKESPKKKKPLVFDRASVVLKHVHKKRKKPSDSGLKPENSSNYK